MGVSRIYPPAMLPANSLIPIRDDNPTHSFAIVSVVLIVLNVAIFFLLQPNFGEVRSCAAADSRCQQSNIDSARFLCAYGTVPRELTGEDASEPKVCSTLPGITKSPTASVITSMFLHGGILHIAGNMLFLWVFGNNIEDVLGKTKFVIFYLLTGVIATLAHVFGNVSSDVPTIGASGAIAGLLGAYIVLFPKARVMTVVPIFFFLQFIRLPAALVLGIWFFSQFLIGGGQQAGTGVAWLAHVGGFAAGALLIIPFGGRRGRRAIAY